MTQKIPVIAYAFGMAANNSDCRLGPAVFKNSASQPDLRDLLDWQATLSAHTSATKLAALPEVVKINTELAQKTFQYVKDGRTFLVIGGDHSCAIGTWSGAATAIRAQGSLGLIWIDAHMDSHTPNSTASGNIHGMPLACLLGYGAKDLTDIAHFHPKVLPENICLIGVRSFETGEAELLKKLKVKVFFNEDIKKLGLAAVFSQAQEIVSKKTVGYGISVDLDAIDPNDAPGVGKAEPDGISAVEFCQQLKIFKDDSRLLGMEIVEFNPLLDRHHKTELLMKEIVREIFYKPDKTNGNPYDR